MFIDLARILLSNSVAAAVMRKAIIDRKKRALIRYFRKQLTVNIKLYPVNVIGRLMFFVKR